MAEGHSKRFLEEVARLERVLADPRRKRAIYLCGNGSRIHVNGAHFYTGFFFAYLRRLAHG